MVYYPSHHAGRMFLLASVVTLLLILFAFLTGNSSLELLLAVLLSQIHMELSFQVSARIEPGTSG